MDANDPPGRQPPAIEGALPARIPGFTASVVPKLGVNIVPRVTPHNPVSAVYLKASVAGSFLPKFNLVETSGLNKVVSQVAVGNANVMGSVIAKLNESIGSAIKASMPRDVVATDFARARVKLDWATDAARRAQSDHAHSYARLLREMSTYRSPITRDQIEALHVPVNPMPDLLRDLLEVAQRQALEISQLNDQAEASAREGKAQEKRSDRREQAMLRIAIASLVIAVASVVCTVLVAVLLA